MTLVCFLCYSFIEESVVKESAGDCFDEELLLTATGLKARHPISYADAFAAALAMINNCPLMTGDPEFRALEKQDIINIEWLT
jgi:predicted nucleic acid-binding protein